MTLLAAAPAVVYVLLCAVLFAFQRSLIYYPQPSSNREAGTSLSFPAGAETVKVATRPHGGPDALIYFGGNGDDVSQETPKLGAAFPDKAIYALDYPGYGGSSGKPTEKAIFADALALFDRVHAVHSNIEVEGRSLGSGVAVWVASQRPVARLILVTAFDSLVDPAAAQYPYVPVRWLLRDRFESWRYAPRVTAPTLIVVAENDQVVPRSSSDRLRTRFRRGIVSYVLVPNADHNTISDSPGYWALLNSK